MMNIVILDDQEAQIHKMEKLILSLKIEDTHIQKYQNEDVLFNNIKNINEYSIFLIDIVLNQKSGVEVAQIINEYIRGAIVIFISNYLDKVVDIYDVSHYYFIYKPELEKRLPIALNKAVKSLDQMKETLPIICKGKMIILHTEEILYLERQKHTTFIIDQNQEVSCSHKLDEMIIKLPSYFIRCHRSFIVNAKKVREVKRNEFILENNVHIPISRTYQKVALDKFQKYLMGNL